MTALVSDQAPIGKPHDRVAFGCSDSDLNLYLQKFVRQNHESSGGNVSSPRRPTCRRAFSASTR